MKLSDTDIDKLLTDLSSSDTETREKAERFYSENKAEILPRVSDILDRKVEDKNSRQTRAAHYLFSRILIYSLFAIVFFALNKIWLALVVAVFVPLVFMLTFWIAGSSLRRDELNSRFLSLLKIIDDIDEPRYVGYMLDILKEGNLHSVEIVTPILYKQLRRLKNTDADLLNEKQHEYLRQLLIPYGTQFPGAFNSEKALAILKALEQIGNKKDCYAVNEVVKNGGSQNVRDAARECLIHIKQRSEMVETQKTLLRASENTGGQDELLRAANAQTDTQPETLLRVPKEDS